MYRAEQPNPIDFGGLRRWVSEAALLAQPSPNHRPVTTLKADGTPTTTVDKDIERFLVDRIRKHYPTHRLLTEEGEGAGPTDSEFLWAIDPLDGTRAYASGLPIWGISVGVMQYGSPVCGVFLMPALREMYWGDQSGAFCNNDELRLGPTPRFDDPLTFLAVPSNVHLEYEIDFPRIRSFGSTAAHLIYVARGAAIGALLRRVKLWDVAGVLPMLNYAGIELRYLSGVRFDSRDLLNGESAREPLVAAHQDRIERVQDSIRLK